MRPARKVGERRRVTQDIVLMWGCPCLVRCLQEKNVDSGMLMSS